MESCTVIDNKCREKRIWSSAGLNHENIVKIFDVENKVGYSILCSRCVSPVRCKIASIKAK